MHLFSCDEFAVNAADVGVSETVTLDAVLWLGGLMRTWAQE